MNHFHKHEQNKLCFFGLVCSLLLLSACATTKNKEIDIEKRAMDRWEAVLSGDLETAYEYLTPGYRSSVPLANYQRSVLTQKVKWTKAQYIESECTETICKVRISLDFALINALRGVEYVEGDQDIEESWLLIDGNWYLVLD